MFSLFSKEVRGFFNSLTGHIVLVLFLLINGLFIWVFPGNFNVLDQGYASLHGMFEIAPWVFLFLIPAITMKMFAEEKKTGTLELLLTRPVHETEIVLSKFLATLVLVALALLPLIVYYYSIHQLASPVGNVDGGGFWGSFIGLFFLAASYAAIGVFTSSLTDNQVVAFILALALSFSFYMGFEFLGALSETLGFFIVKFGINEHYQSMSRGLLDSRDVIYFISLMALFIYLTRLVLLSRKWK